MIGLGGKDLPKQGCETQSFLDDSLESRKDCLPHVAELALRRANRCRELESLQGNVQSSLGQIKVVSLVLDALKRAEENSIAGS